MNHDLDGKRIAILVADGFEESELIEPKKALEKAGARAEIISPAKGKVKGWRHTDWAISFPSMSHSIAPTPLSTTGCFCQEA